MKNESTVSTIETAAASLQELVQKRSSAAAHLQKIDRKIEELEQPDPNLELLKSRKAELFGLREDILACGLLGEKPTRGGLTLAEVNQESAAIDKKIAELAEQLVTRRMQASGLSRRRIDASTELQAIDRQLKEALRSYLTERMHEAVSKYESAAAVVREQYPLLRGLGTWICSINDGCRWPFLDDISKGTGGHSPVLPYGVPVEHLQAEGVQTVFAELKSMLPPELLPQPPHA